MEKIKLTGSDQLYEIQSIRPTSEHVLQIIFADAVPDSWDGDIQLYTAGAVLATTLTGWNTVYRDEGQTMYLSDDGSVYVPPADPEPVTPPEPYEPTIAELQSSKKQEISQACRYYSAADMQTIITTAMWHVSYHTTYCNALNMWISGAQTAEEIQQIFYGADVPEQYQSEVLKAYLVKIAAMAGDDVKDAQTA